MEANDFIAKLKADGSDADWLDIEGAHKEYLTISTKLTTEDRGTFSVNVLCILCRNIDKVPSWASAVDLKSLLTLAIDCVRSTRGLAGPQRTKTLACIYHVHKYVVKQRTQKLPPEMVLKISYMAFESTTDNLLKEYCKTYWNLLADRLAYIERLKAENMAINKLFSKLTEDILKVVEIYETVHFCASVLAFLIAKLHALYSDCNAKELNNFFGKVFQALASKADVSDFKKLAKEHCLELYVKFSESLYVIAENSSKLDFKDCVLTTAVRSCTAMLGHCTEIFHCLQTFYLNGFCTIFDGNADSNFTVTVLNSILVSCETTAKIGYTKTLTATYPFLNQCLRLYIDYFAANSERLDWKRDFNSNVQDSCLKLVSFVINSMRNCQQQIKCENCKIKNGAHDALRLCFVVRHFISVSVQKSIDLTEVLPVYYTITLDQYKILKELCTLGCTNHEKYYKKLQADIHNCAITLNKANYYEYSIKLFDVYLENEIAHFKTESDLKNIGRALYNKSICELDCKLHENALKDAYLSLVFAQPDCLNSDKHMSLVMDIKAKALKSTDENEIDCDDKKTDELQLMTVVDVCEMSVNDRYGNLRPFFCNLKFSVLLKHEFSMYVKLWPSIVPIAGVWRSLLRLTKKSDIPWLKVKDEEIRTTLYEVVLETTASVRTIHSDYYSQTVKELLDEFKQSPTRLELKMVEASLLFLKAEYELHDASKKYGWKGVETTPDDQSEANRTLLQEHEAMADAVKALHTWMDTDKSSETSPAPPLAGYALQIASLFVPQFLQLHKMVECLQLAHICCNIAKWIGDKQTYLRNASVLVRHASSSSPPLDGVITEAKLYWPELVRSRDTVEAALVFVCDLSTFYAKVGLAGVAARLVRYTQAFLLDAYAKHEDIKLDLAQGRLLEAQSLLCTDKDGSGPSMLSAVNGTHRHYVAIGTTGTTWSTRRYYSTTVRHLATAAGVGACARAKAALLLRRARTAAASARGHAAAADLAALCALTANAHVTDDTQVKIDNHLKHILGLPSSNQPYTQSAESKKEPIFTPKQEIETMLENMTFRNTQLSPSLPSKVPGFKVPDFLTHDRTCQCYACQNPVSLALTCQTIGLEASMYFRAKQFDIAKNYFDGCLKCFASAELKLGSIIKKYRGVYASYVVDIVEKILWDDLRYVQLHVLIENAFFELSQKLDREVDEKIVSIHEILQEYKDVDLYLRSEILNLLTATAKLRKHTQKPPLTEVLEAEFEELKLLPKPLPVEPPKTPEMRPKNPPKITKTLVGEDEVPNSKRRVIKLNFDDESEATKVGEKAKKRTTRLNNNKLDLPVLNQPQLELMTPRVRPKRGQEKVAATETSDVFATPKPKKQVTDLNVDRLEFATPMPKAESKRTVKSKAEKRDSVTGKLDSVAGKLDSGAGVSNLEKPVTKTADALSESTNSALENSNSTVKFTSVLDFATPKPRETKNDFFTPIETPSEQFFTPMTSLKTYTKKTLRQAIVKNLGEEFSTPQIVVTKENDKNSPQKKLRSRKVETGYLKAAKDKGALKRATSPGKLEKSEKKPPLERTRLRRPVKFSFDSPDDCK